MQRSKPLPDRIIFSFADSILQSIVILLFCIAMLLSMFTKDPRLIYAMYLPIALGIIQLLSAVVRIFNYAPVRIRKLLYFYWLGVLIVLFVICIISSANFEYMQYILLILSAVLGMGYCCLSWYHSFYLSKKTNHV